MQQRTSRGHGSRVFWVVMTGLLALALVGMGRQVRRVQAENRALLLQNDSLLSANLVLRRSLADSSAAAAR